MHLSVLTILASSSLISARHLPLHSLQSVRNAGLSGWSVQASTCPAGSTSCGDTAAGACCPSGMFCATPANSEVAACCPFGMISLFFLFLFLAESSIGIQQI